jgi:chemotaxis protein MotB
LQAEKAQWQERHTAAEGMLTSVRQQLQQWTAEAETAHQRLRAIAEKHAQKVARQRAWQDRVAQSLLAEVRQQKVTLQDDADSLRIQMAGEAVFRPGQVTIRPQSQATLDKLAELLQALPELHMRVEGHTDSIPVQEAFRTRWPTNWELSAARAASVVRYFEGKGIAPQRLSVAGYGASRPVTSENTEAGRAQNRRIDLLLLPPEQP